MSFDFLFHPLEDIDTWLTGLLSGAPLLVALAIAFVLGLRHASDPDHLAAVTTLIATEPEDGTRRAGRLGLAWGLGHAATLALFGLPIVLFHAYLPDAAQRGAEALVGVVIVFLAARLLVRWRSGRYHAHAHRHGGVEHRHLHPHSGDGAHAEHAHTHEHEHAPEARLGRSPREAFGLGLVHGTGGSAGVGVLLLATIPGRVEAVGALVVLALGTAASMTLMSSAFGYALTRGPVRRRMLALAPAMASLTLVFGCWYVLGALGAIPYVL
jgi:ABC-type nickel/cobalt efflux system permease component RcnA